MRLITQVQNPKIYNQIYLYNQYGYRYIDIAHEVIMVKSSIHDQLQVRMTLPLYFLAAS